MIATKLYKVTSEKKSLINTNIKSHNPQLRVLCGEIIYKMSLIVSLIRLYGLCILIH